MSFWATMWFRFAKIQGLLYDWQVLRIQHWRQIKTYDMGWYLDILMIRTCEIQGLLIIGLTSSTNPALATNQNIWYGMIPGYSYDTYMCFIRSQLIEDQNIIQMPNQNRGAERPKPHLKMLRCWPERCKKVPWNQSWMFCEAGKPVHLMVGKLMLHTSLCYEMQVGCFVRVGSPCINWSGDWF